MAHRRTRDRGAFRHANLELMIAVAVILLALAIAIPTWKAHRARRGTLCLGHLVSAAEGAACPYTGAPYAAGDVAACPTPAGHLDSAPRFVRKDGAWRLEQTLPAYAGGPVALGSGGSEASEAGGRRSVLVKPPWFMKYVAGPALLLFTGFVALYFAFGAVKALAKRAWSDAVLPAFGIALWGTGAWFAMGSCAASHAWTFEPGRVTRTDFLFGALRSEKAWTGCLGVVPVPSAEGDDRRELRLVHAPVDGVRTTALETVAADRLDLVQWINDALK